MSAMSEGDPACCIVVRRETKCVWRGEGTCDRVSSKEDVYAPPRRPRGRSSDKLLQAHRPRRPSAVELRVAPLAPVSSHTCMAYTTVQPPASSSVSACSTAQRGCTSQTLYATCRYSQPACHYFHQRHLAASSVSILQHGIISSK